MENVAFTKFVELPVFTETRELKDFPTKDLYVQVLCEDKNGQWVVSNEKFDEMLQYDEFSSALRCGRVETGGYNIYRSSLVLFCDNRKFQITKFMYRTKDMNGNTVGGLSTDDFGGYYAAQVRLTNLYMGDDNKAGF